MKKLILASILLASCSTIKKVPEVGSPDSETTIEVTAPIGAYSTTSKLPWVIDLVRVANCVKQKQALYDEIASTEFTRTNGKTSKEIAMELRLAPVQLEVFTYWNPVSKMIAVNAQPDRVRLNSRKHPRAMPDMIETVFHEPTHNLGYFHNGNYNTEENRKTVPYMVGAIARKHIGDCK